jgi:glycosyltransferase involved in cell wall biosynthesis
MSGGDSVVRVLQVHTRYRLAGGEDQVVEAEKQLLESGGVEVTQVIFDNADLRESESVVGDLGLAASAIWSRSAERRVAAAILSTRPQVMHVHNTFPLASPSVYSAAAARGVPVVQTLHNYRFICPAATVFRDGRACTDCVGRLIPWPAVVHACVRGSRPQSAVAAATLAVHRARGTFTGGISAYVALSSFQRQLMIVGGLPAERICVIPNFLEPDPGEGRGPRSGALYVGRLAEEKGIATLLRAAAEDPYAVRVAGEGPLAANVQAASAAGEIEYLGRLSRSAVEAELKRALALVLPSIWFEGFPFVVVEAYGAGTPIIASRIGSLAELIEDGVTGLLVEPNNPGELADRIRWARDHPDEMRRMGSHGRHRYETRYRGTSHLAALLHAYAAVTDKSTRH